MFLLSKLPLSASYNSRLGISLVLVARSKALVICNILIVYKALILFL